MKRWAQPQSTQKMPKSHIVLGMFAILGFGIILISLAVPVFSAPSTFNNPTVFGHDPGDISAGSFFGSNPVSDRWVFPGIISPRNSSGTTWDIFVDATSSFLGLRSSAAGPTLWMISTLGNVGIGTSTPTQKLDVAGQIHATGNICTDASGGKCLSDLSGAPYVTPSKKLQIVCNPSCDYSSAFDLTGNSPNITEGTLTVSCPAGMIPLSCGGGAKVMTASEYLRGLGFTPRYTTTYSVPSHSFTGCEMMWKATSGTTEVQGFVQATCVSLYP